MAEWISVGADRGETFDALFIPSERGRAPGIVMLTEIFGINDQMRAAAQDWSRAGYAVLVPDLFWRQQRRVNLGYDGPDRARAFELYGQFDHDLGAADIAYCLASLRDSAACSGSTAVIGYCFGGTLAWLSAVRSSPDVAISFYGTQIHRYLAEADRLSCRVGLHIGDNDAHVPAEVIRAISAVAHASPRIDLHLYPAVGHAFMNPARPTFDAAAAQLARRRALDLLQSALPAMHYH